MKEKRERDFAIRVQPTVRSIDIYIYIYIYMCVCVCVKKNSEVHLMQKKKEGILI